MTIIKIYLYSLALTLFTFVFSWFKMQMDIKREMMWYKIAMTSVISCILIFLCIAFSLIRVVIMYF